MFTGSTVTASWLLPCAWLFVWVCLYCLPSLCGEGGLSDPCAPPGTAESSFLWHHVDAKSKQQEPDLQRSDLNHQQLRGTVHPVGAVLQMSGLQTWKFCSIRGSRGLDPVCRIHACCTYWILFLVIIEMKNVTTIYIPAPPPEIKPNNPFCP